MTDEEIAKLVQERDALEVRLGKAIDVRDNVVRSNEAAQRTISALQAKLDRIRQELPAPDDVQLLGGLASGEPLHQYDRAVLVELHDKLVHLRRLVERPS